MADQKTDAVARVVQGRSPAYPYIDLGKAIEKAMAINDAGASRTALPPETFYKIWNLGAQSSGARQTMAALNHFGLVEYLGRGDDRKVKLSELALRIVHDKRPESTERLSAIQEAALTPPIHTELYEKYGQFLPADVVLETFLLRDKGFNDGAAQSLVAEYKATLELARLDKPGNMPSTGDQNAKLPTQLQEVAVGDLVQVEINGVLQLPHPKRVRAVQEHQGAKWVFIEGSETGIPMTQTQVVQRQKDDPNASAPPRLPAGATASPGEERMLTTGLLAKGASFKLFVSGRVGAKEIDILIRKLQLDKEILADPEPEDQDL